MANWGKAETKRLKRAARTLAVLAPAAWLAPVATGALLACGAIDVGRHRHRTAELFEKYFAGNGVFTWLLSPLNLLADLLADRNPGRLALSDLPPAHRAEVEACLRAFVAHGEAIKRHIAAAAGESRRSMLTFRWYGTPQPTGLRIPEFEGDFRFIKTIAVSAFNRRVSTSRHFGPLRLTYRVLYNLEPVDSTEVRIEVDGVTHYWKDDPLFIFDDTFFHQSLNGVDTVRHCLFMDIVRPSRAPAVFDLAVRATGRIAGAFKRVFYRNWSFIR